MRFILYSILTCSALLFSFTGRSDDKVLRISTLEVYPAGFKENGQEKGFLYEISNEIAERAGLEYVNILKPYSRVVNDLNTGKSDFSLLSYNQPLEGKTIRIMPLLYFKTIVVGQKGNNISSLTELAGKDVGIVRGASLLPNRELDKMNLIRTKNFEQGIKMLKLGRLHAFISADIGMYYTMKKLNFSKEDFGEPYIVNRKASELQISHRFSDEKTIKKLKSSAEELVKDGTIKMILSKYVD
ncbi:transporter substrate-binding domain-containing protein [Vibrio profundum]|uniref:substrate-binding periplasmic protein n=1 Tax=Vibrio profundum TaxID=2910247 RepID=UPI003D0A2605